MAMTGRTQLKLNLFANLAALCSAPAVLLPRHGCLSRAGARVQGCFLQRGKLRLRVAETFAGKSARASMEPVSICHEHIHPWIRGGWL